MIANCTYAGAIFFFMSSFADTWVRAICVAAAGAFSTRVDSTLISVYITTSTQRTLNSFLPHLLQSSVVSFTSATRNLRHSRQHKSIKVFPLAMMSTTCVSSLTGFISARCYASAVLAMGLCLSVCLSVTSRSSTKTAKHRITQTTPQDSPGTPVFCSDAKDIREIRPGSPTTRAPNAGEVGQYRRLLTNNRLHLETGTR